MISNIESGKGDLTARIQTKTKSELLYITTGINQFIETLQNIMRDVKSGSKVLASSSEEVKSQLRIADDNVTNTSAALEELSANMETLSGTVSSINDRVEDVNPLPWRSRSRPSQAQKPPTPSSRKPMSSKPA